MRLRLTAPLERNISISETAPEHRATGPFCIQGSPAFIRCLSWCPETGTNLLSACGLLVACLTREAFVTRICDVGKRLHTSGAGALDLLPFV